MTIPFQFTEEFRLTSVRGVTTHIESGLDGTIRADGQWRPLPYGSCAVCQSVHGQLRGGFKRTGPAILCSSHKDERWRKPRPPGITRWDFEDDIALPGTI